MDTLLKQAPTQAPSALASDSFFFMSAFRSFTTSGCVSRFTASAADGADLQGSFQRRLQAAFDAAKAQGVKDPIMVGAIPFDPRRPSALFIPQRVTPFCRRERQRESQSESRLRQPGVVSRKAIPEQAVFEEMVARGADATRQPGLDKVVLSRLIDITTERPVDCAALFERLAAQNPDSFNFHVPLADGGALIGASPELLLRMEGSAFSSLPLAGSARRDADPHADNAAGEALMRSRKDRHEHKLVTDAMRDVLAPRASYLALPDCPRLITTPTLWHLSTPIKGQARNPAENALSLACLLHPTPALSGFPDEAARRLIHELEPFERDLFGGIVGWCDAEGNGEWVVTIRCARLHGSQVRLFAGAGIVPASSPTAEWQETGTKLSTMLNVFGLN
ncbi:isochorismate synthase EntC [Enterobacteriaceae bacterium YMB-R22]|uniref:isochorismate synthase EntC n=1 Tax=Tenebrionicola larvae TaxID=2815733 RepID=UPI0020119FAF|nr:isochorismate synthase EntC [Tenebrionicola larvae]MBV4413850.1 isochorismate synthase EntC [Tenebrionicola larvae]